MDMMWHHSAHHRPLLCKLMPTGTDDISLPRRDVVFLMTVRLLEDVSAPVCNNDDRHSQHGGCYVLCNVPCVRRSSSCGVKSVMNPSTPSNPSYSWHFPNPTRHAIDDAYCQSLIGFQSMQDRQAWLTFNEALLPNLVYSALLGRKEEEEDGKNGGGFSVGASGCRPPTGQRAAEVLIKTTGGIPYSSTRIVTLKEIAMSHLGQNDILCSRG